MALHRGLLFICFVVTSFFVFGKSVWAFDLQKVIDEASEGEVINIPEGQYEGPFVISKPLILYGSNKVVIRNADGDVALHIKANNVRISGFVIDHENESLDSAAVLISGNRNEISDVSIRTTGMGIILFQSQENTLKKIEIEGPYRSGEFVGSMMTRQGNGIDLFQSHFNVIENVSLKHVQDGVYIESGEGNIIQHVTVSHSRYGFHLMFTRNTRLLDNISENNITGAMVMETEGEDISRNEFRKQSKHVHSQGLMLYNVHHARIEDNVMVENLIGLYVESSSQNQMYNNQVFSNYIGLEVLRSNDNEIQNNDFVENVISARSLGSNENNIAFNFWDSHLGFDVTGDGKSEISYYADPIFSSFIAAKPAYQLFAESPGLLFLQMLIDQDRNEILGDQSPRMSVHKPLSSEEKKKKPIEIVLYSLALIGSLIMMKIGVKKR